MSFKPIVFFAAVMMMASCASLTPAQKLDSFVDKTEENSEDYSSEDWKKSMSEYEALIDDLSSNELSDEDKKTALKAIGRYHALLIKNGLKESSKYVKEMTKLLPQYLQGFSGAVKENSEELSKTLRELMDTSGIESSLKELGSALEEIFGGVKEQ